MSQDPLVSRAVARTTEQDLERGEEASYLGALAGAISGGLLVRNDFGLLTIVAVAGIGIAFLIASSVARRSGRFSKSLRGIGVFQMVAAVLAVAWTFVRPLFD